jgi:hypothetical protein
VGYGREARFERFDSLLFLQGVWAHTSAEGHIVCAVIIHTHFSEVDKGFT